MMTALSWYSSAEEPALQIWWYDDDGDLIDFSSGVTGWSLKIGNPGSAAVLTKTTGITGAAGTGSPGSGTPNVQVVWAAGQLNITPGVYSLQLTATTAQGDRVLSTPITIRPVVL